MRLQSQPLLERMTAWRTYKFTGRTKQEKRGKYIQILYQFKTPNLSGEHPWLGSWIPEDQFTAEELAQVP